MSHLIQNICVIYAYSVTKIARVKETTFVILEYVVRIVQVFFTSVMTCRTCMPAPFGVMISIWYTPELDNCNSQY